MRNQLILAMFGTILASGCSVLNLEDSIGVGPDDNAILRVDGASRVDLPWADLTSTYCRAEFPAGFDIATLTPAQISAALSCPSK